MARDPLPLVRALCLALPETSEKVSHGDPTFFVRGKTFVTYSNNHHGDGHLAIVVAAPPGAQPALVAADASRYYVPPFVGHRGWVGMDLPGADWDAVGELIEDAYRTIAPPKLLATIGDLRRFRPDLAAVDAPELPDGPTPHDLYAAAVLERVRATVMAWPGVVEETSFGAPVWRVAKKSFASWSVGGSEGRLSLWCKSTAMDQAELTEARPGRFFIPPYLGPRGWVAIDLNVEGPWDEVEDVLRAAHRLVGPRKR
jgi:hypothetical protein